MSDWALFGIIMGIILSLGIISQIVSSNFKKKRMEYSSIPSSASKTGAQVAEEILSKNNIKNVQIVKDSKEGRDHYDPHKNIIVLSPSVYDSSSIAAIAIAAHETGHAIQWGHREIGIRIRDTIAKPVMIVNQLTSAVLSMWILLAIFGVFVEAVLWLGLVMYASTAIFQLATLPVEYGASRKAKQQLIELGYTSNPDEIAGTKSLLTAAANTYLIATLSTLIMLATYILLILARSRR
ncbi:MAG: zinc metallopeptidase [Candidatus Hepatoplasma vulgare]|nr:MAG: zinc metallopeptidase [Candidatus Hepatoplasma sp.]